MKKITLPFTRLILFSQFFFMGAFVYSQDDPFNCVYDAYLFQTNDIYAINLATGTSTLIATDVTAGNINAAAYNPTDGYMWGSLSTPANTIVRIGSDFSVTSFYIPELPATSRFVGDIRSDGIYFMKIGSSIYQIDVDPDSGTYGQYLSSYALGQNINVHDWAFNAADGYLYAVEKSTNILYRLDADTGSVTSLGEVPILSGLNYTYGAVYFDVDGNFYVSSNDTGTIYIINNVQNLTGSNSISSNLFAFGPSSSSNDGARCPTAPVPQENCSNGIDDDGDGLVDCDDPSCSGTGSCPVIDPPTSGGGEGGLESNDRLVEKVNLRNYNRIKLGYSFDPNQAKRVKKSASYGMKKEGMSFNLQDFIPLQVINEDFVVESTPYDLIQITNATDIYAVDYLENDKTVASIMAIKTDGEVYEHTKYVCDRLLGGELLSVSTIQIGGRNFIRSIIKNLEGNYEFTLSFSARLTNNDSNFSIESHWNLDQYIASSNYYNFQIWSNSLDDLYLLGNELLQLVNNQKEIVSYNLSEPPTVYVKKGKYSNGYLYLDIVNTNYSQLVNFEGGIRKTETSTVETFSSNINLDGNFISHIEYPIGSLFDIGLRIGSNQVVPDDLFLADGSWGVDVSAANTNLNLFEVVPNDFIFDISDFPIERNVSLSVTTSQYVSLFRSLTPRFNPVDLTEYNSLYFSASGTGIMEIRLLKSSISIWEQQPTTYVSLTDIEKKYKLPITTFVNSLGNEELNDVTSIVFSMASSNGALETKELDLKDVRFSKEIVEIFTENDLNTVVLKPNPMNTSSNLEFIALQPENLSILVYNQLGKNVMKFEYDAHEGRNQVEIHRNGLATGIYFCKIKSQVYDYVPVKLLID